MPKIKTKVTKEVIKPVSHKTKSKKTPHSLDDCRDLVKLGLSAAQHCLDKNKKTTDGQQEGQSVVSLNVNNQTEVKDLLEVLAPLISIIKNLLPSKPKTNSVKISDNTLNIYTDSPSNGPDSIVLNINLAINININNTEQK